MEGYVLVGLLVLGTPVGVGIWLVLRALDGGQKVDGLTRRLGSLESEVYRLKREIEASRREYESAAAPFTAKSAPRQESQPEPVSTAVSTSGQAPQSESAKSARAQPPGTPIIAAAPPPAIAAVAPAVAQTTRQRVEAIVAHPAVPAVAPSPPRLTASVSAVRPAAKPASALAPAVNWEQFMGVKLFAWVGGLALFLGVAFFVKYSFDNNLVPPELRVALGFLAGLGLLVGGVVLSRKQYAALSQTLCATGVVILYAVTFACRSIYHFEFFGTVPTFLLMVLITTTAFLLAVRLEALVVAVLGMLGGFLTPILLSSGQDNPLGLFGYIAILDAGLILVAHHRRWYFLTALAAAGTCLLELGWAARFFVAERYFEGDKILVALGVLLGFNALYLGAAWWASRRRQLEWWLAGGFLGLAATALGFIGWFLSFPPVAGRPWLMFGAVFLLDWAVAALVLLETKAAPAHPLAGLAVFVLLAAWTSDSLNAGLLNAGLVCYLLFAVSQSVFPVWLQRRRGVRMPFWAGQFFPPLALVLVLIPIFQLKEISLLIWLLVALVDLLVIGLAALTASLLPVLAVMGLTLTATAALIFKIPSDLTGLPSSFFLLGAFVVFFAAVGIWLTLKFKPAAFSPAARRSENPALPENIAAQLPALAGILPFLLLIMATLRLPLANPSPVFGLALLLVVLLLGVTRLYSLPWMAAVALGCVAALEGVWHVARFVPMNAPQPLVWYLVFYLVFTVFPFVFRRRFENGTVPWAVAAMAGPPQFLLLYHLIKAAYPNGEMGLLPAAFALPPLMSLVLVLKRAPAASPARMAQLAWYGGVALFFITLIFPIQFERQWITLGWALEGAALLWLLRRVPHEGLKVTGAGLLLAAFCRLAVNPAVLEYHARSGAPILNWYLYAYGVASACLFAGARWLPPARRQVLGINAPPVLAGLGIILLFLLVNIEIADYFSVPGETLTFQFSGSFARDMTYSIAWALFALALLIGGILRQAGALRHAGLGLLSVTILKLFFHDLASLGQLYRIGALIGVALIAMLASFAYQRFFASSAKEAQTHDELPLQ